MNDLSSDAFKGYGIGFNRANSVMTSPLVFEKILNEGEDYFPCTTAMSVTSFFRLFDLRLPEPVYSESGR